MVTLHSSGMIDEIPKSVNTRSNVGVVFRIKIFEGFKSRCNICFECRS